MGYSMAQNVPKKTLRYTGIATNRMSMAITEDNPLGTYLKDRRAKLDPADFGFSSTRRRTPGLRREEVAQRANVSATWYTWLEQGRGGAPSAEVLDHIAKALALTEIEREHLFLLAQNRPPEVEYQAHEDITPKLQCVLDSLEFSPAFVKTPSWDVVGWNRAAAAVLTDYGKRAPGDRNILRLLFCDPGVREEMPDWESDARFAVAAFRADAARAGANASTRALVDELCQSSLEFEAMWLEHDVRALGEGIKSVCHPGSGSITLEYSAFAVDGKPDLGLVIYTPATVADRERVKLLVDGRTGNTR